MGKIHDATGQRIGQLIVNAMEGIGADNLFYISDDQLIAAVKSYIRKMEQD